MWVIKIIGKIMEKREICKASGILGIGIDFLPLLIDKFPSLFSFLPPEHSKNLYSFPPFPLF